MPSVLIAEHLDPACAAWLAERCEVEQVSPADAGWTRALERAEGLVVRTYTRVDEGLLRAAPRLRVVGRAGVGLDNIDLAACAARGVAVVHTPAANTSAVVEYVTALALDALRPRLFLDEALPAERWKALRKELVAGRQIRECAVGVVGLGKVGSGVARVMGALGARVLFTELREVPPAERGGAENAELDDLLATADIVTLHVDERPSNRGLIDARRLRLMREDAVLINTSRGFVVDPGALATRLRERPAARALLDVHDPEPFGDAYPLLGLPNAHLAPHLGAATRLAHRNMSWVVRDVHRVLAGEAPEHPAPPPERL